MADFFYIAILVVMLVGSWTFLIIFNKRKKEKDKKTDNIYAAISTSNITSVTAIAQTLGLSISETRELIEELIKKTKHNKKDYKLLNNAYIDYRKDEIVLHPKANDNLLNKTIDYVLDGFSLKKKVKKDWICNYCDSLNKTKTYNCLGCGATKAEEKQ